MSGNIEIVCGNCDAVVRLPRERLHDGPKCSSCHGALFAGKPVELTEKNFDRHLERSQVPVVVDFWAPWCGPCIAMAPHFESAARQLEPAFRFAKLNTQDEPAPAGRFGIRGIPTLIVFREGREITRQTGAMDAQSLTRWLGSVR